MTYMQMLEILIDMSPERLQDTATVFVDDEYRTVFSAVESDDDTDVLDNEHLVLFVE